MNGPEPPIAVPNGGLVANSRTTTSWRRDWIGNLPRLLCAGILLFAVAMKLHHITNNYYASIYKIPWWQTGLIAAEWLLAAWLIIGSHQRWCRSICLFVFAGFACYNLYLVAGRHSTCGCFGELRVDPTWMLALDLGLILLAWRWRPAPHGGTRSVDQAARIGRIPLALQVPLLILTIGTPVLAIAGWHAFSIPSDSESIAAQTLVVLKPEQWIGRPFPLIDYIQGGEALLSGSWIVLFYHHDCPDCRKAIEQYQQLGREFQKEVSGIRIALLEVPPHSKIEPAPSQVFWHGRLSTRKEWFVATPSEVELLDGQVLRYGTH